jgi:hypothetical protein
MIEQKERDEFSNMSTKRKMVKSIAKDGSGCRAEGEDARRAIQQDIATNSSLSIAQN